MTTPYLPTRWMISAADLSDDPDVFPYLMGQSLLQLKTPIWSTKVDTSVSGVERRRALWSYPIWKFRLSYDLINDTAARPELAKVVAFFNAHGGSFKAFFYYDRFDNTVSGQLIGVGDGTTTGFQLLRSSTVGGITFTEPVRGVSGTPTVLVGGTPTTAFTIGKYGTINFVSPPPAGASIMWSGQFFFLCRFLKDELDLAQFGQGMWQANSLEFQSVKP